MSQGMRHEVENINAEASTGLQYCFVPPTVATLGGCRWQTDKWRPQRSTRAHTSGTREALESPLFFDTHKSTTMTDSNNPLVPLDANSLYICTSQLMANLGKFHWTLYVTDADGSATKYHWAQLPNAPIVGKAEGVVIEPLPAGVFSYSEDGIVRFGFWKITGFSPPSTKKVWEDLTIGIFDPPHAHGYKTVLENRMKGVSCRIWLVRMIDRMKAQGYIDDPRTGEQIHLGIAEKSTELEVAMSETGYVFQGSAIFSA